ncbi:MAG: S41 family peptidase [Bacteroidales bacterium]|nr:S41 family peptidase [Bacteroidales bacterium]
MNKSNTGWLAAFLGVVIGILGTVAVNQLLNLGKVKANYAHWQKLTYVMNHIRKNYVDTVDVAALTDAAIAGALAELDPHSSYLPPVELQEAETELAGNFDGIGIQFNVPNDTAVVLEVIKGGPAEKVGMLKGDRLLKVDDAVIAGVHFPQDSMVRRMKGPAGTKVNVTILRDGAQTTFEIARGKIPVHCVDAAFMINDTTGYLRLTKFSRNTHKEVDEAARALLDQGMSHLIFDLRDNTGGYFDQAILLSDMFLDMDDEIVYLEGLHRPREDQKASGKGILKDVALSVLINENTASSSEIFSGAIQDNDRGVIIGRRSFGKGLVQEPVYFSDGSAIRLTISRFYTPSGRCIQKPYDPDYRYDIYKRYASGEMFDRDSVKIDSSLAFRTVHGRTVYGGGGIIPDVFVPLDTTRASAFFIACNRKATQMRFATSVFDSDKKHLSEIDDFQELERYLDKIPLKERFLAFAASKDGIRPAPGEWEATESYLMPQLRALVGRYSKLGENAFYKLYLPVDETIRIALDTPARVVDGQR